LEQSVPLLALDLMLSLRDVFQDVKFPNH